MPSQRRIRLIFVGIAVTLVFMLYRGSGVHSTPNGAVDKFYRKTVSALDNNIDLKAPVEWAKHLKPGAGSKTDPKRTPVLHDVEGDDEPRSPDDKSKPSSVAAPLKPDSPSEVVGVGSSADGQVGKGEADAAASATASAVADESQQAEADLNLILKKAPVIIFSKTWCPHSKRAKRILLERYTMEPAPYVVELDEHPHGSAIQALLKTKTRRSTVPNVLVNGISIGGADDVVALDGGEKLVETVERLGSGKVTVERV